MFWSISSSSEVRRKWVPKLAAVSEQGGASSSTAAEAAEPADAAVAAEPAVAGASDAATDLAAVLPLSQMGADASVVQRSPSQDTVGDACSSVAGDSVLDPAELDEYAMTVPEFEQCDRTWKRNRDTKPQSREERPPSTTAPSTTESAGKGCRAGRTGNIGWYFGNFGILTTKQDASSKSKLAERIRAALKKTPAQIIGLAECDAALNSWGHQPETTRSATPTLMRQSRQSRKELKLIF